MNLAPEVLDWLLEPAQPAVRYGALVDLLDQSERDPEVLETRATLPERGWAAEILAAQRSEGHWDSPEDLYRPKYTATIWRLIVLSDLGLTADEPRIRRACELFLSRYARKDGGFDDVESPSGSELCVTGNLTRTLQRCGLGEDPRVRAGYAWVVGHQREDGGWHCFHRQTFGRGTLDGWEGLYALAFLPESKRTPRIQGAIERGAEFFLERNVFHQGKRYVPWTRTHYPVHYYYDFLVGLDMLTRLGYGGDRRLGPALELLRDKRQPDGRWPLDAVHPDLGAGAGYRLPRTTKRFALEGVGEPSKWITLTALQVLKRVDEAEGA